MLEPTVEVTGTPPMSSEDQEKFQAMLATMMSKFRPTERIDGGSDRKFELGAIYHVKVYPQGRQSQFDCGYIRREMGPAEKLCYDMTHTAKTVPSSPRAWQLMFQRIPPVMRTPALTAFLENINIKVQTMDEKLAEQGIVEVV